MVTEGAGHGRPGVTGCRPGLFLLSLFADLDEVLPRLAALGVGGEPRVAARARPPGGRHRPQRGPGRADGHRRPREPGQPDRGVSAVSTTETANGSHAGHAALAGGASSARAPGGLGLAIRWRESGRRDFVLFEATDGVGGTWRVNTYPGAACDVPSHLYSYSFALKPDWIEDVRQAARDPASTSRSVPIATTSDRTCAPTSGSRRRTGTRRRALGPHRRRGPRLLVRRGGERHRDVHHTVLPPDRRSGEFRGAVLPFGALGARARPDEQAGGGDRDGGERGADRARGGQDRGARRRLPTDAAVDPAAARTSRSATTRSSASPTTRWRRRSTATSSSGRSRTRSPFVTARRRPTGCGRWR